MLLKTPAFRRLVLAAGILAIGFAGWLYFEDSGPGRPPSTARETVAEDKSEPPSPVPESGKSVPAPEPMVRDLGENRYSVGAITFDKKARTITIPAAVNMTGEAVEYVLVSRHGKVHESVFITDADARDIHLAALLMGMKPAADLGPENAAATVRSGAAAIAWAEWDRNGPPARVYLNETVSLSDPSSGENTGTLPSGAWLYNGSRIEPDGTFAASRGGSIISIIRDDDALVNNPGASRDNDEIHTPNAEALPKTGHPVRITLQLK